MYKVMVGMYVCRYLCILYKVLVGMYVCRYRYLYYQSNQFLVNLATAKPVITQSFFYYNVYFMNNIIRNIFKLDEHFISC